MSASSYKSLEEGRIHYSLYDKIFRNTRVDRFLDVTLETIISIFAIATFIYLVIEAIRERIIYLFIGACIFISMIFEVKLVKYYRKGELEPKFKKLIIGFGISIISQCGIALFIIYYNHKK